MRKIIILSFILGTFKLGYAQNLVNQFWETDGAVNTSVRLNNKLYIGGEFSYAGPTTGSLAAFRAGTGNTITLPVKLYGKVNDVVRDNSGNIYLGGRFSVNDGSQQSLIKLTAALNLDNSFQFNFDGEIKKLAINGNNLYTAGSFSYVNSSFRLSLASIDLTLNQVTSFAPNPDGQVMAITVANGNLYVGGLFNIISASSRKSFAAYNSTNSLLSLNIPINGSVKTLAIMDSLLFAGGSFDSINGLSRNGIGSVNLNTGSVRSWEANVTGTVNEIAINVNSLYIGGNFSQVGTQIRNNLASVNLYFGIVDAFDPGIDAEVSNLKVTNGTVYIGGNFNTIGFDNKSFFAGIAISSSHSLSVVPRLNGPVSAMLVLGDTILAGGSFSSFGGKNLNNLAALDLTTGVPVNWPVNIDGTVNVLKVIGNEILVGGNFQSVNTLYRMGIAIVDTLTGTPTSFDLQSDGPISDVIVIGSGLYLAGSFGNLGSSVRNNLALVNASSGTVQSWNPNVNGPVTKLTQNQTQLYAVGNFNQVGTTAISRIASFELSNNGELRNWTVNADSSINNVVAVGSSIILGGVFSNINGESRTSIASVDSGTAITKSWQAQLQGNIMTMLADNGILYVGGNVSTFNNSGLLAFNSSNGQEISFPVKLSNGAVTKISRVNNILILGGNYTLANAFGKSNFSVINLSVSAPSAQASAVSFSQVTPVSMRVNFHTGGGDRYLVLAREASSVDSFPINGQTFSASTQYGAGNNIGSNYVVYNGSDSTFVLSGLNTSTTYYFAVFAYNGFASFSNYLTANPATGSNSTISGYNPPSIAATNITFNDIRVSQMIVKWVKGNGNSRYVVVREATSVNQIPSDSTQYFASPDFGSGTDLGSSNYIVYNGSGDSVLITNLKSGVVYYYKVFEYNGFGQFSRVLSSGAPASSQQTLSLATEPSLGSSALSFSNISKQSVQLNWVNGNGSSRIVIASEGTPVVSLPSDGNTYLTDNTFNGNSAFLSSNERVVYSGTGNQFNLTGLKSSTIYHFAVIEFNGSGYTINYQSNNFVRGNITTISDIVFPLLQAKNVQFTMIGRDSIGVKWTRGDGTKRLVAIKKDLPITSLPLQSGVYNGSTIYGAADSLPDGSFILSYLNNDSLIVSNLLPNTRYYIAVFESNSSVSGLVFLTDSFATAFTTTLPLTGLQKINSINAIKIYPNPLRGEKLHIELSKFLIGNEIIMITDIAGKTVYKNEVGKSEKGEQHIELDLHTLPDGQYLLQVIELNSIYTIKLLIN